MRLLLTLSFLLVLLLSFLAQAKKPSLLAEKTIVLPLNQVLVQLAPERITSTFPKEKIISVTHTTETKKYKKIENKFDYVIRPHSQELLSRLVQLKYKIKILSMDEDKTLLKKIIKNFHLPQLNKNLDSYADIIDSEKNLKKIDPNFILFVGSSDHLQKVNFSNKFDLGPVYYIFANFQAAQQAANTPPALTEEEWSANHNNLARLVFYIEKIEKESLNFSSPLSQLTALSIKEITDIGSEIVTLQFSHERLSWSTQNEQVSGCEKYDLLEQKSLQPEAFETCIEKLPQKLILNQESDQFVCQRLTHEANPRFIKIEGNLENCLNEDNGVKFLIAYQKQSQCEAYTKDQQFIAIASSQKCADLYIYIDKELDKTYTFKKFPNQDSLSEEQLLKKLRVPPPDKDNPIRLWDNTDLTEKKILDLKKCLSDWQLMRTGPDGKLLPECEPDTLYSWGPVAKIDDFKKVMGRGSWAQNIRTIFSARSPLSTFGYGPVAMRIKLKKGTRFQSSGHLGSCPSGATVFFRNDNEWSDWAFCNTAVIHSWSYLTKEHYDEIVKAYQVADKYKNNILGNYDVYGRWQYSRGTIFIDSIDGWNFKIDVLFVRLRAFLESLQKQSGEIFFNPDLPANEKTSEKHFSTEHPIYFNEE